MDCETFVRPAPQELMPASHWIIWQWLLEGDWQGQDTLLVGVDCLINIDPRKCFTGNYELGVTTRPMHDFRPINTGATVFRLPARDRIAAIWEKIYRATEADWGKDLEAIAKVLGPVPREFDVIEERHGVKVGFLDLRKYNYKATAGDPAPDVAVVHFKGSWGGRKNLMIPWAEKHLGYVNS